MAYSGISTEEQEEEHISGPEDTRRNKPTHNRAEGRRERSAGYWIVIRIGRWRWPKINDKLASRNN